MRARETLLYMLAVFILLIGVTWYMKNYDQPDMYNKERLEHMNQQEYERHIEHIEQREKIQYNYNTGGGSGS